MLNNEFYESIIRELAIVLQKFKIYERGHPLIEESLDSFYNKLKSIFTSKQELIIGIIDNEFVCDNEVLIDLSKKLQDVISYLISRKVERIKFSFSLTKEELKLFFEGLSDKAVQNMQDFINIKHIKNIDVSLIEKDFPDSKVNGKTGNYFINWEYMDRIYNSILQDKKLDALNVDFVFFPFLDLELDKRQHFLRSLFLKRQVDETIQHSLNVAFLSMYLSLHLGFSRYDVIHIGVSGFLHDIGKAFLSKKLIMSLDLREEEFMRMQMHTLIGAKILINYVDKLGIMPVIVASEHHIRYDGGGYPRSKFFLRKPSIPTMIVSICDVYDALRSRRSYKAEYEPPYIYKIMEKEKGRGFSPYLLDVFFKIIGVWPIDSILELDNGEIVCVEEQNPNDIFRPKVKSFLKDDRIVDLREKDTMGNYLYNIKRYIKSTSQEGENYLKIIRYKREEKEE